MKDTTELCLEYTNQLREERRLRMAQETTSELLDAACSDLQKLWRRELTRAVKGTNALVYRARVWANVDHSKRPVTVMPIASATVNLRQGHEVTVSFRATEEAIRAEAALIARIARLQPGSATCS